MAAPLSGAFTAAMFLALFASERPNEFAKAPERLATAALAAEQAQAQQQGKWRHGAPQLSAAIATVVLEESGLAADVHSGAKRGKAGEVCLVQIHPKNPQWRFVGAPSFESLAGTDLQATTWCLATGVHALVFAEGYCAARRYKRNWQKAMFTLYHLGGKCWVSPVANKRTKLMNRLSATKWVPTPEQVELVQRARHSHE